MKKILLNGCSFVAGDALTWDMHYPNINWIKHIFQGKLHPIYSAKQIEEFRMHYSNNLRPADNLKGQLEKLLTVSVTDLSVDGNSNDNIAMSTIGFLNKLSVKDRQQYHVCIGWTELTRRLKWLEKDKVFFNMHLSHLNHKAYKEYSGFIKESIINPHNLDHFYNFCRNVLLLQSYLKLNNISYTFWRNLGNELDIDELNLLYSRVGDRNDYFPFNHTECFDKADWINFNDNQYPWLADAWGVTINETRQFVSHDNCHPNLESVKNFSLIVADKIKDSVL